MTTAAAMDSRQVRARKLPLRKAARTALRNIKIRFWRSLLVTSGIILAVAFLAVIMMGENLATWAPERGSAELLVELKRSGALAAMQDENARVQAWWVVGIAMVIAFVGILNSTVMAVTERTREIGTMKCLGALDSFIVKMYLLESLFQGVMGSVIGGLLGLALGYVDALGTYGGEALVLVPPVEVVKLLATAVGAGIIVTLLGAIYPALRAARMEPVDAMRTEV